MSIDPNKMMAQLSKMQQQMEAAQEELKTQVVEHSAFRTAVERGRLTIDVTDNGVGLRSGWVEGVGLSNTRARLQSLYAHHASMMVAGMPGGGTVVTIVLPMDGVREARP